jgi:hypothetical protein
LDTSISSLDTLNEEKIRLLREIAQLKGGKGSINNLEMEYRDEGIASCSDHNYQSQSSNPPRKTAQEVAQLSFGSLRVYEMMLGLCFITIILNWILMP